MNMKCNLKMISFGCVSLISKDSVQNSLRLNWCALLKHISLDVFSLWWFFKNSNLFRTFISNLNWWKRYFLFFLFINIWLNSHNLNISISTCSFLFRCEYIQVEGTLSVQPQANPVVGFEQHFLGLNVENNVRNPWFVGKCTKYLIATSVQFILRYKLCCY